MAKTDQATMGSHPRPSTLDHGSALCTEVPSTPGRCQLGCQRNAQPSPHIRHSIASNCGYVNRHFGQVRRSAGSKARPSCNAPVAKAINLTSHGTKGIDDPSIIDRSRGPLAHR